MSTLYVYHHCVTSFILDEHNNNNNNSNNNKNDNNNNNNKKKNNNNNVMSNLRYLCFLRIVVSNIYCVVFLFCFSSSCVPYVSSVCGLSNFDFSFGIV